MPLVAPLLVAALLLAPSAEPARWTQFGGPERNFETAHIPIPADWKGPQVLWERDLGPGYAGVVTDGERLVTMTREGDDEVVLALDPKSGRTLWWHAYPAPIPRGPALDTSWGEGPNGTPLLVGDRVITLGFTGILVCLDVRTGEPVWSHELLPPNGGGIPFFGLATSPIRFGDLVIAVAGGARAFRIDDGEPAWANTEFDASYASPVMLEHGGGSQLIVGAAGEVVGVRPSDGELLWRHEHANEHNTILSSPVVGDDDRLFVSAYFLGSIGLEVSEDGKAARELWENPKMQISYTNAILDGSTVFGFHNSLLKAVNLETGELLWQRRGLERGNLLRVGERYLLLDRHGKLVLLTLDDEGFAVLAEAQILEGRSWTAPALDGSILYARNLEKIVAVDLSRSAEAAPAHTVARASIAAPAPFLAAKTRLIDAYLRSDPEGLGGARAEFEQWTRDPQLGALAHYYRGFAAYNGALLGTRKDLLASLRRAEEDFLEAVRLDRALADAHAFLGRIFPLYWSLDPRRAAIVGPLGEEHLATALRLAPDNPRVLGFQARGLFNRPPDHGGDRERGLAIMRRALEVAGAEKGSDRAEPDWGSATLWLWYGQMLERLEEAPADGADAASAYRRALDAAPQFLQAEKRLQALEAPGEK